MEDIEGDTKMKPSLGKSLLVPSVKDLITSNQQQSPITCVPPRYIQSEPLNSPLTSSDLDLSIPILNMEALIDGDPAELQSLHRAAKEWGFFQVMNHGIKTSLIEGFKMEVEKFFNLSKEEKRKYWQGEEDMEGFGQLFVMSEEQKLDWADMFFLTILPKNLQKPHLLPKLPPSLRDTMEEYASNVQNLSMQILDCLSQSLGMVENKGSLRDLFGETTGQTIRMNYYPPCPEPDKVIGFTPHSDADGLTILLQTNEMEGLQIKKDGSWISVKPLPHAFVVNMGNMLEIMTNGEYRSVEHRAIVNKTKERISVAAFHSPGFDEEIGPARCLITLANPARFSRMKVTEYFRQFFARKLDGKSQLDVMRIH